MGFSIQRKDVDAVVQAMFPGEPEAYGFYAELSGFGTSFYIVSTNETDIVLTYMGKVFMDPKDSVRYALAEIERLKVKKKLVAYIFDLKPKDGRLLPFVVSKRAMDFSDYQKSAMERLEALKRG